MQSLLTGSIFHFQMNEYIYYLFFFLTNLPLYLIIYELLLHRNQVLSEYHRLSTFSSKIFRNIPEEILEVCLKQDDIESNSSDDNDYCMCNCTGCSKKNADEKQKDE